MVNLKVGEMVSSSPTLTSYPAISILRISPMDVIYRRYQAGINNLFQIYMPRVDYWLLADNSISPRVIVAEGYQHGEDRIYELELFKCIKNYVK